MPDYYIYFISSLPMLHFGARSPFSFEHFLRKCTEFLPEADVEVLKNLPVMTGDLISSQRAVVWRSIIAKATPADKNRVIKEYVSFDTALRNELVKIRAQRKHIDVFKYQRPTEYSAAQLISLAIAAYRSPLAQDAEKALDEARWQFLDGLCFGHYFDLEFLIIYAYKLKILERWERVRSADKAYLLEEALKTEGL